MSDKVHLAGDGQNMTEDEYKEICEYASAGDFTPALRLFITGPPKPLHEMTLEEKVTHKHLLQLLVRELRVQEMFVIRDILDKQKDLTELERKSLAQWDKANSPKAKEATAEKAKIVNAKENLIEQFMASKGWDRRKATEMVNLMMSEDGEENA